MERKIARFASTKEASDFSDKYGIVAWAHPSKDGFILIAIIPQGVIAVHDNGQTGEVLRDW